MSKIKRTKSISEAYFFFVVNTYPQIEGCVQRVNRQIGEELAVCSIEIKRFDAALLGTLVEDMSGRLDNPLFEIDSYKFIVSDSKINSFTRKETVSEAMNRFKAVDYIFDVHVYYNERKGVWGHLKVFIFIPHSIANI